MGTGRSGARGTRAVGNLAIVKLLLEHGADPNEEIDSASSPLVFAATPDIRALLEAHGAGLGDYDTTWIEHDDERLKSIAAEPQAEFRIGAAFTMSADRPDVLARLLGAGLRMPAVHTSCQGYLLNPDALRTLLAHGMSPDQMNWQHQTLLHHASTAGHDANAPPSCSMPAPRSPPETTNIARRRWPGPREPTNHRWSSSCCRAAPRSTCRTMSRGRRRWPGPSGVGTSRLPRFFGLAERQSERVPVS